MYQREKKADTQKVLITTTHLGAHTMIPTFLPRSEALLEIILCHVFSTFCSLAWISSMVSSLHPFILISILGKRRKKSQGAKSGKKGVGDKCYVFGGAGALS
jgi:hypothetical protein